MIRGDLACLTLLHFAPRTSEPILSKLQCLFPCKDHPLVILLLEIRLPLNKLDPLPTFLIATSNSKLATNLLKTLLIQQLIPFIADNQLDFMRHQVLPAGLEGTLHLAFVRDVEGVDAFA
jgi:hypothetical protein